MSNESTPQPPKDPFPKMFIICGIIAALLFALVAAVILIDFMSRNSAEPVVPPGIDMAIAAPLASFLR